jgi:hypothetical protein
VTGPTASTARARTYPPSASTSFAICESWSRPCTTSTQLFSWRSSVAGREPRRGAADRRPFDSTLPVVASVVRVMDHNGPLEAVSAVLLDMDGTLVESDAAVERAWSAWAAE